MKARRTVALPRPKGTRATSRVALTITMHPRQLDTLTARAAGASMSLTAYVAALLESDADDLPARAVPGRRINWLEDSPLSPMLARRCGVRLSSDAKPCARPLGHRGAHFGQGSEGEG